MTPASGKKNMGKYYIVKRKPEKEKKLALRKPTSGGSDLQTREEPPRKPHNRKKRDSGLEKGRGKVHQKKSLWTWEGDRKCKKKARYQLNRKKVKSLERIRGKRKKGRESKLEQRIT